MTTSCLKSGSRVRYDVLMKWTTELPPATKESDGKFYWFKGTIGEHKFVEPTIVQLFYNEANFNAKPLEVTMWPSVNSSNGEWSSEFLKLPGEDDPVK